MRRSVRSRRAHSIPSASSRVTGVGMRRSAYEGGRVRRASLRVAVRETFLSPRCFSPAPPLSTRPSQATTTGLDTTPVTTAIAVQSARPSSLLASRSSFSSPSISFAGAAAFVQTVLYFRKRLHSVLDGPLFVHERGGAGLPRSGQAKHYSPQGHRTALALIGQTYTGPSILLLGGTEHFLALTSRRQSVGSTHRPHPTPFYSSNDGISWTSSIRRQCAIPDLWGHCDGRVPEPSTWR